MKCFHNPILQNTAESKIIRQYSAGLDFEKLQSCKILISGASGRQDYYHTTNIKYSTFISRYITLRRLFRLSSHILTNNNQGKLNSESRSTTSLETWEEWSREYHRQRKREQKSSNTHDAFAFIWFREGIIWRISLYVDEYE